MNLSPEKKIAGVLAPLFALRRRDDLGIGDLATLREFIEWAAEAGFKVWKAKSAYDRGRIIKKAAELLRERADQVARVMTQEQGKTLAEA